MRETFLNQSSGREAYQPAGTTLDWTIDESAEMAATTDTINTASVVWTLPVGLTAGTIVNTTTKSSIFIAAPADPVSEPYRCTLTFQTTGGRTRVKAFWLYVLDPILFT